MNNDRFWLVGMHHLNMFEERRDINNRPAGFRCKLCDQIISRREEMEAHHAGHVKDKSQHATEQIRARREHTMAKDANKQTPKQQGFPAVYLNEDGSKFFPPGADARAKSDLIHAFHGWDNPHAKHQFTQEEAAKLLAARGWNGHAIKAADARQAKLDREKAKAATRATAAKSKAASKKAKASDEVQPDPKPAAKPKGTSRRLRPVA